MIKNQRTYGQVDLSILDPTHVDVRPSHGSVGGKPDPEPSSGVDKKLKNEQDVWIELVNFLPKN